MARFQQLNSNIYDVLISLTESQTLCKLLHSTQDDPLSEEDVEDTTELLYNKIFPFPYVPDVQTAAGSFLSVFFDNLKLLSDNKGTKELSLVFNVIVHKDLWRMTGTGMLRPYAILHELDEMFNNKRVAGIKKIPFDRGKLLYINSQYSGYQVQYQITSVN